MLTGGNNYAKQSGGEVVTAYAPDTAVDYLLLRHQPRFDYYARFFHMLSHISAELLSHPIPHPQKLTSATPPAGASAAAAGGGTLTLAHCTTDDPAHPGRLDASQQWTLKPATTVSQNG